MEGTGRLTLLAVASALLSGVVSTAVALTFGGQAWVRAVVDATERAGATGSQLVLRDVVDFPWDRFVAIGPDADPDDVQAVLGSAWSGSNGPIFDDGHCLLVFLSGGRVVRAASISRQRFDCSPVAATPHDGLPDRFTPDDAVFSVRPVRWSAASTGYEVRPARTPA